MLGPNSSFKVKTKIDIGTKFFFSIYSNFTSKNNNIDKDNSSRIDEQIYSEFLTENNENSEEILTESNNTEIQIY